MEDIAEKLSELLQSPDAMEKISSVAAGLFGGGEDKAAPTEPAEPSYQNGFDLSSLLSDNMPDIGSISKIMRVVSLLKSGQNDKRTNLLLALKPHLSSERAKRVDKAISLLKIASLLPVLKEEGILDLPG